MKQPRKFEMAQRIELTPELIETVRQLYAGDSLTNVEIGLRYGKRPNWVNRLASQHGWPLRKKLALRLPGPKTAGRQPRKYAAGQSRVYKGAAEWAAAQRESDGARQRDLYGADLADVEYLRRRGFAIHRERDQIRCNNDLITFAEMREKAARERRLEAAARPPDPTTTSARKRAEAAGASA